MRQSLLCMRAGKFYLTPSNQPGRKIKKKTSFRLIVMNKLALKKRVAKSNDRVFFVVKTWTTIRPILFSVSFTFVEFTIISSAKFVLPILILNQ